MIKDVIVVLSTNRETLECQYIDSFVVNDKTQYTEIVNKAVKKATEVNNDNRLMISVVRNKTHRYEYIEGSGVSDWVKLDNNGLTLSTYNIWINGRYI